MTASSTKWIAWFRLLRPPNLPTVPGDPLAGFVLASGIGGVWDIRAAWVALASLAIYASGLVLNDVADCEVDRRERPNRPLPSGAVKKSHALAAGLGLGILGVALAFPAGTPATAAAVLLFAVVLVYDFLMPRGSVAGVLVMGLCRSASVGLGIAAAGNLAWGRGIPWLAAAGTGLYIAAVSIMAAGETSSRRVGWLRWLPLAVLAAVLGGMAWASHSLTWLGLLLIALPLLATWDLGRRLGPEPGPSVLPPAIGGYIRALLLLQAAYCAMMPWTGLAAPVILLCLWPLSAIVSKKFYAS